MFPLSEAEIRNWDKLLLQFPDAHILQTSQWAEAKAQNGWQPLYFWAGKNPDAPEALALILKKQVTLLGLKFTVLYCPKGPVLDWEKAQLVEETLQFLQDFAKKEKAIFIKIDPDVLIGTGESGGDDLRIPERLEARGWQFSQDQIQFRNTVLIDLSQSEEELLAAMKQKTRYNIRLAVKKGVVIREGKAEELAMLYKMYAETAVRDDFVIRGEEYYLKTWRIFLDAGMARILIAEADDQPIAALILFHFNGISRYMYGMSTAQARELMPNHLLQWEAIRLSKSLGCQSYDFWGAPDVFDESDSMWGVYRFKQGFNGTTARHIGAWDFTPQPLLYKIYTQYLPKLLDFMRRRGKAKNKHKLQG